MEEMGGYQGGSCITSRFPIANISGDEGSQYTYCQALEQVQDGGYKTILQARFFLCESQLF
jgi:hypothetical protein